MATARGAIMASSSCPRSAAWPCGGRAVAVRWSRPLEGTPKTVTISQEADGWYAIIACADVPAQPLPATGRETGIDVGLKVFLITADGEIVANPRHYRHAERRLKKAQRRVARRKKGSQRRRKAVGHLQRAHQTVQRQRQDFHHKTSLHLLREHDTIYLEDLRVANLVRTPHLAKSISDAGWAACRAILDATAAGAGRRVVAVPPA
jgi:putative transposase